MWKRKYMTVEEIEARESRKAVRKFRNRYLAGSVIVPTVKWGLMGLGALTVYGLVTNAAEDTEENE